MTRWARPLGPLALGALLALAACRRRPDPTLARMLEQRRVDPFEQAMRDPPEGTVSREDDRDDEPPAVDPELLRAGKAQYAISCAPCHGRSADGRSYVAERMRLRPPPPLASGERRSRARIYRATTDGYGLMPALAAELDARTRWAVASYVESLRPGEEGP